MCRESATGGVPGPPASPNAPDTTPSAPEKGAGGTGASLDEILDVGHGHGHDVGGVGPQQDPRTATPCARALQPLVRALAHFQQHGRAFEAMLPAARPPFSPQPYASMSSGLLYALMPAAVVAAATMQPLLLATRTRTGS